MSFQCSSGSGRYRQLRLIAVLYLFLLELYNSVFGFSNGSNIAVHSFGAIGGYLLGSALLPGNTNSNDTNQHETFKIVGALYYFFFLIILVLLNVFYI